MKKLFIVLVESSTDEQNTEFLEWIKAKNLGWWHWFQNAWLLTNSQGHLSSEVIRDELKSFFGTANTFVMELTNYDGAWSGFGPNTEKKNMFKWLHDNWKN